MSSRDLYPFLFGNHDSARETLPATMAAVQRSTLDKCHDIVRLRTQLIEEYEADLAATAMDMAGAFAAGGKLIAFGNGGSATDAHDAAIDCMQPPLEHWRPLPALSLVTDTGVLTAVANDVGFENIFVRQITAFGQAGDMALGFSTSGNSTNVLSGLQRAKQLGMHTIAMAGDKGGDMANADYVDRCFVARIDHVPRIQEGHATLWHSILELTQMILATGEVV